MNEKHMTDSKRRLIFMNLLINCIASALLSTAQNKERICDLFLQNGGAKSAMRLTVMHNLWFYNHLMERIRDELDAGTFTAFHDRYVKLLDTRI